MLSLILRYLILIVIVIVVLGFSALFFLSILLLELSPEPPKLKRSKKEETFLDPTTGKLEEFPSLDDPPSINLSVIVPAYNEEQRLVPMLDECLKYLEGRTIADATYKYEVIVVDDGSKDETSKIALEYSAKYGCEKVRVLTLIENRGKGGAVKLGMLSARGEQLLFADADGATKFPDYSKLECALRDMQGSGDVPAIVCGSRAHLEKESIAQRSIFRTILMYGFHFLVWLFAVRNVKDTQCGFKLLTRQAARTCFANLHILRWAFDVELLYIAQRFHIPIAEVAVNWTEIEGSKVVPFWSWLEMGRDLFLIWLRYLMRIWKLKKTE